MPAPNTATVSSLPTSAILAPNHDVGKMPDNKIAWSSLMPSGNFTGPTFANGSRAYWTCSPLNGPDSSGPPKKAVPPTNHVDWPRRIARRNWRDSTSKSHSRWSTGPHGHPAQVSHIPPHFFDDAHGFVTQDGSRFHPTYPCSSPLGALNVTWNSGL